MIRVYRGDEPDGFRDRVNSLINRFENEKKDDQKSTISKFWDKVRPQLRADADILFERFHRKCAFCESSLGDVSFPHLEHYRPKGKPEFEHLAFEWNNWLIACEKCNKKKGTSFPVCNNEPCIIDPVFDDPTEHLEYTNEIPEPKTERGNRTISITYLDREPLAKERTRWLSIIRIASLLLLQAKRHPDETPYRYEDIKQVLLWCMQDDAPYAAMSRCYIKKILPNLKIQEDVNSCEALETV